MRNYSSLSPQAYSVLDEIKYQYGCVYVVRLAANLGIPVASVRRAIQELRRYGYKISLEFKTVRLIHG